MSTLLSKMYVDLLLLSYKTTKFTLKADTEFESNIPKKVIIQDLSAEGQEWASPHQLLVFYIIKL